MKKTYDIVLIEKETDNDLTKDEVLQLFSLLGAEEGIPLEVFGPNSSAMGFIANDTAEKMYFNYAGIKDLVYCVLSDFDRQPGVCEYEVPFPEGKATLWLSK